MKTMMRVRFVRQMTTESGSPRRTPLVQRLVMAPERQARSLRFSASSVLSFCVAHSRPNASQCDLRENDRCGGADVEPCDSNSLSLDESHTAEAMYLKLLSYRLIFLTMYRE
jgi:hypothetical protein